MSHPRLDNLVRIGRLKAEPAAESELQGLVRSGTHRLDDAARESLSLESRFDLACNAGHALALAALRLRGYGSESRYLVFQCLEQAHRKRNLAELTKPPAPPCGRTSALCRLQHAPRRQRHTSSRPIDRTGQVRSEHCVPTGIPRQYRRSIGCSSYPPDAFRKGLPVWHDMHMESTIYQLMVRTYSLALRS